MAKSIQMTVRSLHRDVGFILIGIIVAYAFSGIILIFRTNNLLMYDRTINTTLERDLLPAQLEQKLRLKRLNVVEDRADALVFDNGIYNKQSGEVSYTVKQYPLILDKVIKLHKVTFDKINAFFAITVAISLSFLAISSFFMFKTNTAQFRRGVLFTGIGVCLLALCLFFA